MGAGESGVGAALLAQQQGYAVWVSDKAQISADRKKLLIEKGIGFEEGGHSEHEVLNTAEIVKSPGIPLTAPIVKKALGNGIEVIDELEFACRYSKGKVIGITGTNGKTTTTLLTYHLLQKEGFNVGLAGNVGQSWAAQLVDGDKDWWVIEMSSFQIDGFKTLKPHIGILTNITPDHLDRYDYKIENYIASKLSLFKLMGSNDAAIFYQDDKLTQQGMEGINLLATPYPVSTGSSQRRGGYYDGNKMDLRSPGRKLEIDPKDIVLKGKHNALNTMMASLAAMLAGVSDNMIHQGLADFKNAAHRMQEVAEISGVRFINDSKGTNIDAAKFALDSFTQPVIWIAGGVDKGNDYSMIEPLVKGRIKALICLGKENGKLKKCF